MNPDKTSDSTPSSDGLADETILDDYRAPECTEAACARVRARIFRSASLSKRRASFRWSLLLRTAAMVAIAAGLWIVIAPRDTLESFTVASHFDHDAGFPEMRAVAVRLTRIEENISQLDNNYFWGDNRLRSTVPTGKVYRR